MDEGSVYTIRTITVARLYRVVGWCAAGLSSLALVVMVVALLTGQPIIGAACGGAAGFAFIRSIGFLNKADRVQRSIVEEPNDL